MNNLPFLLICAAGAVSCLVLYLYSEWREIKEVIKYNKAFQEKMNRAMEKSLERIDSAPPKASTYDDFSEYD